jgi:sialic acid synthase SpsE
VSAYPTPIEDANLAAIRACNLDGFSDHTRHILTGALAVAAGARILEVHFCLPDTRDDNPDRVVSHEPEALAEYVRLTRLAAVALGDGVKKIQPSERENARFRYV